MPKVFKRKLYKRGSSFETTIPMPLLFALDMNKRYYAVFSYKIDSNSWNIGFEEILNKKGDKNGKKFSKK